jgi:hypothetical protein
MNLLASSLHIVDNVYAKQENEIEWLISHQAIQVRLLVRFHARKLILMLKLP